MFRTVMTPHEKIIIQITLVLCLLAIFILGRYHSKNLVPPFVTGTSPAYVYRNSNQSRLIIDNDNIVQYGSIQSKRKYAVFGSSIGQMASVNYAFDLPLTAMAWKRIGFDSLIIITGDPQQHKQHAWIEYLIDILTHDDNIVVLVLKDVSLSHSTTISQVSRLFVTSLVRLPQNDSSLANTYFVTSDADTWPIANDFFTLPRDKDILHGDIGHIKTNGVKAIYVPLSYVGMNLQTWHDVMTQSGSLLMPNSTTDILKYLTSFFGNGCCKNVTHGGRGWGMDQELISLRLQQWKARNQADRVHVYKRSFKRDRIDRSRWPKRNVNIANMIDAHILKNSYRPQEWRRLRWLLAKMYPKKQTLEWLENYVKTFCHYV